MTGPYRPDPVPEPTAKWYVHWLLNVVEWSDRSGYSAGVAFALGVGFVYCVAFLGVHAPAHVTKGQVAPSAESAAHESASMAHDDEAAAREELHEMEYTDQCGTLCASLPGFALSHGFTQSWHAQPDGKEGHRAVPFCTCDVMHDHSDATITGEVRRYYGYDFHEGTP